MRRSTEQPDPSKSYVAWQTAAIAEIPYGVLQRGTRLPGSDSLVRARPEFFLEDGENLARILR
jgi:hypothetical protein